MVDVPTGLNNSKTKVYDLDVGKLKTVPVDLKKLSDTVSKEIGKKNNMKVNNVEKKIPDQSTLIQTNQYNTDKQNLEKNIGEVENKIHDVSGLVTTAVLNTKIGEVENKIPDTSRLATTAFINAKPEKFIIKFLMLVV